MAIKILDSIVASRIAAGEVVENPSSMLRELIDNSIDAQAKDIRIEIKEGGIALLSVQDNGKGMSESDLALSCKSHATSKISTLDDLFSLKTMGFRGEALPSISSCTKLTISTNGYRLFVDNGNEQPVIRDSSSKGCMVIAEDLFEKIPARKQFLRRASSEATSCRKVLVEKAMCFEDIHFSYYEDSELKLDLKKADRKKRILDIMSLDKDFVSSQSVEMQSSTQTVSLYAIASDPTCHRRDRTRIRIFVNKRPIDCFPLVQAITNSYSVALPGGAFPYFSLFIEDDPSLVDFNVHPAKRECRMRNQSEVYSLVTSMIRKALLERTYSTVKKEEPKQLKIPEFVYQKIGKQAKISFSPKQDTLSEKPAFDSSWFENAKRIMERKPALTVTENAVKPKTWVYIGQVFNTFLLVERKDELLMIDQHAAHERLLYDEICSLKNVQKLVVPYKFETDSSTDAFLVENSFIYQELGVQLMRISPMLWEIDTVPATAKENEEKIASYIRNATRDIEEAKKGLFAVMACHSAIKSGDKIDNITAEKLIERVFELDAMLCPHGRSFVYTISKEKLYKEVGRTI